ncbi:MAG TPA: DUF5722 domain-containing protein [Tepidisphaeraceae bacterium]|nr:DUF5722 domain-containing protein [Tepidisphaeraceae bacterium]
MGFRFFVFNGSNILLMNMSQTSLRRPAFFRVFGLFLLLCVGTATSIAADALHDEHLKEDRAHADRLTAYLGEKFPGGISSISLDAGRIHLQGNMPANPAAELAEVPMWEDVTALKSPVTLLPIHTDAAGRFAVDVDRVTADGRDRLLSAWAVVRKVADGYEPLSALHYIDSEKPRADLPAAKPRSIKGMGGCPFDHPDMEALGISSVTLNIVLNDIIVSQPGRGVTPYTYAGRQWYVRDGVVARLDRDMKIAAEHQWMVSAIILLRPARNNPAGSWTREAAHPDAQPPAPYAMPNFTSRAGAEAYAAAMNFLAERYSRPDGQFGRIHDWIMHNEISAGFYWTNAGDKTLVTYLEMYQKSMRTIYLLARQYDPHAKPLISLDHCWTVKSDPRAYTDRDLLEKLLEFSRVEGDFEWGIAFHPYAQDLFNPRTWEDHDATFSFNTKFITFKNLEVLDAWARQPMACYHGQPREIQLSEQGLNSRDYSEKALTEQAAGLAYAWKKIEPLKTITAFQYHNWCDAREEGGLRLGIRKFGNESGDPLGKKPAWDVFKAMGTEDWKKASAFAKLIVGIKDWNEVHYSGKIE